MGAAQGLMSSTRGYAALLRSRPSCASAREDELAHGRPDVVISNVKQDAGPMANVPLFLNASVRAVKVLVALNTSETLATRPLLYVPIWKCGTSSVIEVEVPKLFKCANASGWFDPARPLLNPAHRYCRRGPHTREYGRQGDAVSIGGRMVARFHMGPHSAASIVPQVLAAGALTITVVRDPLLRFISGWNARSTMQVCQRVPSADGRLQTRVVRGLGDSKRSNVRSSVRGFIPCPSVLHSLEAHAHNLYAAPGHMPYWRWGWIHWISQVAVCWGSRRQD